MYILYDYSVLPVCLVVFAYSIMVLLCINLTFIFREIDETDMQGWTNRMFGIKIL